MDRKAGRTGAFAAPRPQNMKATDSAAVRRQGDVETGASGGHKHNQGERLRSELHAMHV
jgi:hypothetical protein